MIFKSKVAVVLALALGALTTLSHRGEAATLIGFSQVGTAQTVMATNNGDGTTSIKGNDILVNVSAFAGGGTPFNAYLDFMFTSTTSASAVMGPIIQGFGGTFSITSATNGGINYLSGSLLDFVFGAGAALTLFASTPSPTDVLFTSSVIPLAQLAEPRAVTLGFTNVLPGISICTNSKGSTLCSFTSNVSGNASAAVAVPEPASLAILAVGLLGLGAARRNRSIGKAKA